MTADEKIIDACGRIRSRDDAIDVVKAAVADMKERCAQVADLFAATAHDDATRKVNLDRRAAIDIAASIRALDCPAMTDETIDIVERELQRREHPPGRKKAK